MEVYGYICCKGKGFTKPVKGAAGYKRRCYKRGYKTAKDLLNQ